MSLRVKDSSAEAIVEGGDVWQRRGTAFTVVWWDRLEILGIVSCRPIDVAAGNTRRVHLLRGPVGGTLAINMGFTGTNGVFDVAGLPEDNTWHFNAITYDGSSTANVPLFYYDGETKSVTVTTTPSGALSTILTTDTATYGNRQSLASAVPGNLAHVAMWGDTLLSADEIREVYRRGPLAISRKPTLYRPFDPNLPGGIMRALGARDSDHLHPVNGNVWPRGDADDPYDGAYVGGRRWRAVSRTIYRPVVGSSSGAAIAAPLTTSFSLSSDISVNKPVASSLSVVFSTTQDVDIAKALSSALSVVFSTASSIGIAKPLSSALSVVFSTSSALVGGAAAIASSMSSTFTLSSAVSVSKLVAAALQTTFTAVSSITTPKPVAAALSVIFSTASQLSVASGGGLGLVEATLIWIARVAADVVHRTAQQSTIVHAPQVETTVKSETSVHVTITDRTDG